MSSSTRAQLASAITLTAMVAPAMAQDQEPAQDQEAPQEGAAAADDDDEYGDAGTFEVGGSIGLSWTDDLFTFTANPSVGIFVLDRIELSAFLTIDYERVEDDDTGITASSKRGALVIEPSYHHPIQDELLILGGLGLGVGYDGDNFDFEIIPRIGLNIEVGPSSVVTPAVRVPILIGESHGSDGDVGTSVGLAFEVGITTTW